MKDFRFIGWCNEGKHDKIWGYLKVDGEFVTFWGKRTAKLTFKRDRDYSNDDCFTLAQKKRAKGYDTTSYEALCEMDPTFEDRFDSDLMLTMLGNTFHQNPNKVEEA